MKQTISKNSTRNSILSALTLLFGFAMILSFTACQKDVVAPLPDQQQNEKVATTAGIYPIGVTKLADLGNDEFIAVEKTNSSQHFVILNKGVISRPNINASQRIIKQTTLNGTTYTIEILNSGCEIWMESNAKTGKVTKREISCP